MFSSSLLNGAASSCFNPSIFSDHNAACGCCLLQCFDQVVEDAENIDQVPFSSTATTDTSTPFGTDTVNIIIPASETKKKPDNRSKVRTAQGLRDRRVRLSIGMARKFFDLQDMLGFDKPSRTLEWLFDKSSAAISKLSTASLSSTTSSEFETIAPITEGLSISIQLPASYNHTSQTAEQQLSISDDVMKTKKRKAAAQLLAKESRERARARARSRTVAKLKHSHQIDSNLLNRHETESVDQTTSLFSASRQDSVSLSSMKSLESAGSQKEERKQEEGQQQYEPKQQLEGDEHNTDYGMKTTDGQESTYVMVAGGQANGLNVSLDWHTGSTVARPSSFTAHPLIWPPIREFGIYGRPNWDYLFSNCRSLYSDAYYENV